jgi:hypothetical protein
VHPAAFPPIHTEALPLGPRVNRTPPVGRTEVRPVPTDDFLAAGEVPGGEVTNDNSTASSYTTQARRWSPWLTGACLPAAMAGAIALLVGGTLTLAKAKAGEVRAGSARSRQTGNRRKWRKQRGRGAPATAAEHGGHGAGGGEETPNWALLWRNCWRERLLRREQRETTQAT